jgi:hypothetical protein
MLFDSKSLSFLAKAKSVSNTDTAKRKKKNNEIFAKI